MEGYPFTVKDMYVQCHLERESLGGTVTEQTAFIPKQLAKLGQLLKIRVGNKWEEGWKVKELGSDRVGVPDVQKMIRGHRKHTGDSLPKEQK